MDWESLFAEARCTGSLHVVHLSSGDEIAFDADRLALMASVVKVPIGLEFYAQVDDGALDPARSVTLLPHQRTPGPVGVSQFAHAVTASLSDLAYLMLTISDNAAADEVTGAVGIDRVNLRVQRIGCRKTQVVGTLRSMLDGLAVELGHASYAELLVAQSGVAGQAASIEAGRIDQSRALNPLEGSRTTARDATRLLSAIWSDTAASPGACAALRGVMAQQLTRRLAPAVPQGGSLAAKTGALLGRVRNEVAVITAPGGDAYAVAIFTRAHPPYGGAVRIDAAIVAAVSAALRELRS